MTRTIVKRYQFFYAFYIFFIILIFYVLMF